MNASTISIPRLTTQRLVLRGPDVTDLPDSLTMWSDPHVTRFISAPPATEQNAWARLLRYAGHWALLGIGYWTVTDRRTGDYLGEVGIALHKRDLTHELRDTPEVGWALTPAAHGRGYATEAVTACLAWADTHARITRTTCLIHPANAASIHVAQKCGFSSVTTVEYHGEPQVLFARDASPHG